MKITIYFKNHEPAVYTMRIYNLAVTDPDVVMIVSNETGGQIKNRTQTEKERKKHHEKIFYREKRNYSF